ncbi:hypothetical protein DOE76_14125 [Leifsonia sp. ku-ls]|nr:hypothetical protein DOE76_14125 [Leifsonia sp. ku-ls]
MTDFTASTRDRWASEVVQAQRKYGRSLLIDVFTGALIYVGASALAWCVSWIAGTAKPSFSTVLRNDIAPGTALGAAGVLAAVIIALQVAVRTSTRVRPHEFARARILALVARMCGVGAMGLGFATVFHRGLEIAPYDIWGTWAPLAGAMLLAMLAADASITSNDRQDSRLSDFERMATLQRRENVRDSIAWRELPSWRRRFRALQIAIALVLATSPGVVAALWLSPSWFSPQFALAGGIVSVLILAVCGGMSYFTRLSWLRGDRLGAVLVGSQIVGIVIVYALAFWLAGLEQSAKVGLPQSWGLLIALLLDGVAVVGAPIAVVLWQLSLAGALGYRSLGMELLKRSLDKEIESLMRTPPPRRDGQRIRTWPILSATMVLAVIVAPVGWWVASRLRHTRTWTRAEWAWLRVAWWLSATLTTIIALIAIATARLDLL